MQNAQSLRGNRHGRKPKTKADTAKPPKTKADTAKPPSLRGNRHGRKPKTKADTAKPPDLPRFLSIFAAIAQTMAYSHTRGVIHRDLKPSNVMVGSFGEVQGMDWGLARVLPRGGVAADARAGKEPPEETLITTAGSGSDRDLSRAGSIMGTPSYMSPEQARGQIDQIDERADVFALGAILCEESSPPSRRSPAGPRRRSSARRPTVPRPTPWRGWRAAGPRPS